MKTVLKTGPTVYPIGMKEVKQHLNITVGWTEDDQYFDVLIKVATDKAEQFLRRKLITQTWYAYYDGWPSEDYIALPFGQLQSIASIKYTDTDSDQTEWSTDEYNTDIVSDPGRAVLEYGYNWPTTALHPQNPIVIEYICGYGDAGSDVENPIIHAMKLMLSDMYNNREDIIMGTVSKDLKAARDLLWPYRLHEVPTQ